MIKRLKWNVYYGGGGGQESDGGLTSSDESDVGRSHIANVQLEQLVRNDPALSEILYQNLRTVVSSDSDENSSSDEMSDGQPDLSDNEGEPDPRQVLKRSANSQRCTLCPGKRMLNERDIEEHLKSKRHLRMVAKTEQAAVEDPKKKNDGEQNKTEQNPKRLKKRKAASKQKLKALKERKWKKKNPVSVNGAKRGNKEKHIPQSDTNNGTDTKPLKSAKDLGSDGQSEARLKKRKITSMHQSAKENGSTFEGSKGTRQPQGASNEEPNSA